MPPTGAGDGAVQANRRQIDLPPKTHGLSRVDVSISGIDPAADDP